MSDGMRLVNLFKRHNITVEMVAQKANLTARSIYRYQTLNTIKPLTVDKLLKAAGISKKEWDEYYSDAKAKTAEYDTTGSYHQGMNLHKIIQLKGYNATALADQLSISRPTLYRYFDARELPPAVLLQAADVLGVKVYEIKGFGNTTESFEKDIYATLLSIQQSLTRMEKHLQISI